MTGAPHGACFGRAPPSLRSPHAIKAIDLPGRTYRKIWTQLGYDFRRCRDACRQRGVRHRIARRGIESKKRLGIHRWVMERTFASLHRFRRLAVRYERRSDIHQALLSLGCILICRYAKDWVFC